MKVNRRDQSTNTEKNRMNDRVSVCTGVTVGVMRQASEPRSGASLPQTGPHGCFPCGRGFACISCPRQVWVAHEGRSNHEVSTL